VKAVAGKKLKPVSKPSVSKSKKVDPKASKAKVQKKPETKPLKTKPSKASAKPAKGKPAKVTKEKPSAKKGVPEKQKSLKEKAKSGKAVDGELEIDEEDIEEEADLESVEAIVAEAQEAVDLTVEEDDETDRKVQLKISPSVELLPIQLRTISSRLEKSHFSMLSLKWSWPSASRPVYLLKRSLQPPRNYRHQSEEI